ncbi:MAG: hypothetical protein ABI888_06780 [Chloroflexota bacterium]
MRRLLVAVSVIAMLLIVVAGASAVLGVGPFAPGAAASAVYVALSRSTDEADAREIEVIDLAAGTRDLFEAGGKITTMTLSPDRRSLYVAVDSGRVLFLDAATGTKFAEVDLHAPTVTSLAFAPDGRTLFALTASNVQGSVIPIDLDARKAGDPIVLPAGASSAVARGDSLLVAISDQRSTQVVFVSMTLRAVTDRLTLPRGSLAAPVTLRVSDTRTAVFTYDITGGGGGGIRAYLVNDPLHWDQLALPAPLGFQTGRLQTLLYATVTPAGLIHACVPSVAGARRYVITTDNQFTIAGSECGPLGGSAEVLMARRDPAQLLVLDPATGQVKRTLPLAGVPARLLR